jgi:hypothetical protein
VEAGDFANRISFRMFGPDAPLEECRAPGPSPPAVPLEVANTRLPEGSTELYRRVGPLLDLPRMSTYAMGALINTAVAGMPAGSAFVNVGVWHGFTLLAGMAGNQRRACIGIDDFSQFGGPRRQFGEAFSRARSPAHEFHDMDFRSYFAGRHGERTIGFYVYDGGHGYEDQLDGLLRAEPYFGRGTLVLVDDTNWANARRATLDFARARPGTYEILADRGTAANRHPTFWNGFMLIRRVI